MDGLPPNGDGTVRPPPKGEGREEARKRIPTAFEIVFQGNDVEPSRVSYTDLTEALRAFARLAFGASIADESDERIRKREEKLHLVKIRKGSAIYAVSGPRVSTSRANLEAVGRMIETAEITRENEYGLDPIRDLSRCANKLKCTILARKPGEHGMILAKISPGTYEHKFKNQLIKGHTRFAARIQRVGGASALRCGLRTHSRKRMLICKVRNKDVGRTLGNLLYEHVVVAGEATWIGNTFSIQSFVIDEVRPLKRGKVVEGFKALREAGLHEWDNIPNPRAFLGYDEEENP